MSGTDDIIGGWVRKAEKTGEVKKLPGYGKPIDLDDDSHTPRKYRMAYRVLKNAGMAPPEVELIKEIAKLRSQLEDLTDESARAELESKIRESQRKLDVAIDKVRPRR